MKTEMVKITEIQKNPDNPRLIKDSKFEKLVQSIKDFPEMLNLRPIVVNNEMVVLGGNMRLSACKEAGLKNVPIIKADDLTEEQQKEFIIKDNVSFGEWDWDMLGNEWEGTELGDWGLDVWQPEDTDTLTNNEDYYGLDQLSKLDKFMNAEVKRMFLVFDNLTFEKVVNWFEKKQCDFNVQDNSQVILKLIENE